MAAPGSTPIQTYYSTTGGNTPSAGNLLVGELAVNVVDKKLFTKNGSGTVITLLGSIGSLDSVSLTTNVTGTLPIANGGTGSTSTTYCSLTTNVTGTLPIVNGGTGSTSTTYCSLTTNVTGTLPIANGGTGLTAALTGVVKGDGSTYSAATAGTDYVKPDTTSNFTKGYTATTYDAGTKTTGTFTPDPVNGNFQKAVNGGAFTLAPPSSDCTMIIKITNNGSAGAITTSGFTKVTGSFTTTDTNAFFCYITKCDSSSDLTIKALQ